jgi:hypothetical protein
VVIQDGIILNPLTIHQLVTNGAQRSRRAAPLLAGFAQPISRTGLLEKSTLLWRQPLRV